MKVLYFDCSSGISGNMTLGALSELIDDPHYLVNELKKLNVDGYHIHISKEKKNGITGTYVDVHLEHEHHHEHEEHEHHHHHDHGEDCTCGCHDHEHHHHHHADEVFTSWGMETIVPVTRDQLEDILKRLADTKEFGDVLRAKGMLPTENPGEWLYFDLVPQQYEIRQGRPDYTGKVCVIGASLKEEELNSLFGRG